MNQFILKVVSGLRYRIRQLGSSRYRNVNLNWLSIKKLKHLSSGKLRKHYMYGAYFYFDKPLEFLHVIDEIFLQEIYKQEFTSENPLIIDCGANIGASVVYFKISCPEARIIAFEPDESNFELLSKNVSSYSFNNVELKKEAVWIENTTLAFTNDGSMSSKIDNETGAAGNKVVASRLKDFLEQEIDFLKIDIEGAEYQVLKDCTKSLDRVKKIFIEYHGTYSQNKELNELLGILTESGFNYYIKEADSLFAHPLILRSKFAESYDLQLNIFGFRE